jgi:hypothetical protein
MRPNDMPRPFAPEHSGQHDLAETLRRLFAMSAPTDNAEVANDSPELECVFVNERPAVFFSTLREAADELARLRAEVEGLKAAAAMDLEATRLRDRSLSIAANRCIEAERERDELRRRIAEAPKADVSRHAHLGPLALADTECPELYGKRVALVRLDAEEGK